jgi:hypothetical protein
LQNTRINIQAEENGRQNDHARGKGSRHGRPKSRARSVGLTTRCCLIMLSFTAICGMYNYLIISSAYVRGNPFSSVPALQDYCVCTYDLIASAFLTKTPRQTLIVHAADPHEKQEPARGLFPSRCMLTYPSW